MGTLIPLLEKIEKTHTIVLIYLQEAHADDTWPMGFGILSSTNISERIQNAKNFIQKWPKLSDKLNGRIFLDNMQDEFNTIAGVWPESYIFTD